MKTIDPDWFLKPVIEFEGKSYTFLAWMQRIDQAFDQYRLFPWKDDLLSVALFTRELMDSLEKMKGSFAKEIVGLDFYPPGIRYRSPFEETHHMSEIRKIMEWSLIQIEPRILRAKNLFEELLDKVSLEPLGIEPLYRDSGFLFLDPGESDILVFSYSREQSLHDCQQVTSLNFIQEIRTSSYSGMLQLKRKWGAESASYLVKCKTKLPIDSTLVPLAEKRLNEYLGQ